jgi:hypothetical protein
MPHSKKMSKHHALIGRTTLRIRPALRAAAKLSTAFASAELGERGSSDERMVLPIF